MMNQNEINIWERRARQREFELQAVLKAVLYHFGPEGANKVTTTVLKMREGNKNAQGKEAKEV